MTPEIVLQVFRFGFLLLLWLFWFHLLFLYSLLLLQLFWLFLLF